MNYRFFGLNRNQFTGTTIEAYFRQLTIAPSPVFHLNRQVNCKTNTVIFFTENAYIKYRAEVKQESIQNNKYCWELFPGSIKTIDNVDLRNLYGKICIITNTGERPFKSNYIQSSNEVAVSYQSQLLSYIDNQIWQKRQIQQSSKIRAMSDVRIRNKVGSANPRTKKEHVLITEVYDRDEYMSEYAKRRANRSCQRCGWISKYLVDGLNYIEVHHIVPLANNGADHWSNMVALCPNCHKEMHYSKNPDLAQVKDDLKASARVPW